MSGSQIFQRLRRQSLEDHQQVHFYLDRLAFSLAQLDMASPGTESFQRLAAELDGLRERLDEHFRFEQDGGLFPALQDALPEADADVRRLSAEHRRIVEAVELARIRAHRGDLTETALLRGEVEAFLGLLREHEREEDALLRRALEKRAPA
jgi:hemerythrin HHE cation binding domain-containing protein